MGLHKNANFYLPKRQAFRFSYGWLKILGLDIPTKIGSIIGGRLHKKPNARIVTHPSTIMALGSLTLQFPWDVGEGHPLCHTLLVFKVAVMDLMVLSTGLVTMFTGCSRNVWGSKVLAEWQRSRYEH